MCGIAGIWGKGDIHAMLKVLSHRGPDGYGEIHNGIVQLGALSLKIVEKDGKNQPFDNEDGTVFVALNGEIYNFPEIKKELSHHTFKTGTDTEVIAHAYEEYGLECVNKFNGCFAFAIWDGTKLIIGRDRLGQKPLYYHCDKGRFIFASEIKAILTQIDKIKPCFTEDFFAFETVVEEQTFFEGIYSLPRASLLTYDGKNIAIDQYWELPTKNVTDLNETQCIEKLRELITDSVALRMRSKGPTGIFLSGGLDSSLIAYLAKVPFAFTCHYPLEKVFNELEYAKKVAKDINAQHIVIQPEAEDLKKYLKEILWYFDQPVATASPLPAFLLAKKASEYVRIVLNGEGSDELFSGYIRYLLMDIEQRLGRKEELKSFQPLARFFWNDNMFEDSAMRFYELTQRGNVNSQKSLNRIKSVFSRHKNTLNAMSHCDIDITLPSLLMMADRVCGAHGIENRSPFLDYRIVEFAFSLPPEIKIKDYTTKYILRKAAEGIVPEEIITRTDKMGLITPISTWLAHDLSDWGGELIKSFTRRNIRIPKGKSRGAFDRYDYLRISLELWYRNYFDKNA
ncbi:asparagine synthase (glutamine-hydrolyzing) [Candidatus Omnitrophota bacterium]